MLPDNTSSQADSTKKRNRQEAVNATLRHDKDTKKMKIIFEGDSIREMTVNGKPVDKEGMKEYGEEFRKMQKELESSRNELGEANERLREAQIELELARKNMEIAGLERPDMMDFNMKMPGNLPEHYMDMDQFRELWQNGEFREHMKKAQEDAGKAMREAMIKHQEYWNAHQDEFREEMKKAEEESRKAFKEMQKNGEFKNLVIPHMEMAPPIPDFETFPPAPD